MLATGLLSATAFAQPPSTGLGQAWPNAPDVSVNPNYHAYVFVLAGVQYIQINDANGNVLGSVGAAGGQFIVLPIGHSQLVTTPQQAATTSAKPAAAPTQVYNDGTTTISATPMSDGTTQLQATPALSADDCDVVTCSTHGS
ncbi:hypothetical protein ISN74_08670 [Dyella caseinilytica]|uniref:Uncharacterized protein n=2 Tax=Dyella caseinilytica TaxID=1849581 RepID=A0ABX7H195_9GAMM|nr:hypothetical protein ISN74_08670 [Dyella caseinilytica]GGA01282.1 hypothetical protein GCM10011408_23150 [Dyella caseinilytica]